jgi:hypothetical protein
MINFMTAFLLSANNASPIWWGGFICMLIVETFVAVMDRTK